MTHSFLTALSFSIAFAMPVSAEPLSPVKTAELSARLFEAGLAAQDAILVLTAAKLRKQISPEQVVRQAESGAAGSDGFVGWEDMLAQATELATGDEALLGLIEDARAETTKGVATGPVYNIGALGAGRVDKYPRIAFRGDEYAEVYVEAKSSVDLNLMVLDGQGRLVCSDTDASHIAYCGWRPAESGDYSLVVENKGKASTNYALMTN
jgi:hypothetical protein